MKRPRAQSGRSATSQATIDLGSDVDSISDAVARMSDFDRALIYRSYYLGRTTTQIAAEFGTNDDLVKQHLHCALHALRATLGKRKDVPLRHLRVV